MKTRHLLIVTVNAVAVAALAAVSSSATFSSWSHETNVEASPGTSASLNTAELEGCPAVSKDDLRLFFASTRPGGSGGLDIWVSRRDSRNEPWSDPTNVGAPVNTEADEFCPSPMRDGHGFLFVSTRAGGCGGADIYATRQSPRDWATPQDLGCSVNSVADEASPFLLPDDENGPVLYFSSTRAGGFSPEAPGVVSGDFDIYGSAVDIDGVYGAPTLAAGLNTAANDARPNLRRDGLEIFFDSNRSGTLGGPDLWSATRASTSDPWGTPTNLGAQVNSAAPDTRPSLSWDGTTLYFGSSRSGGEGSSDLYVTTREKDAGP